MQKERVFDNWISLTPEPLWADYLVVKTVPDQLGSRVLVIFLRIRYFRTILFVFTYSNVFLHTKNRLSISESYKN